MPPAPQIPLLVHPIAYPLLQRLLAGPTSPLSRQIVTPSPFASSQLSTAASQPAHPSTSFTPYPLSLPTPLPPRSPSSITMHSRMTRTPSHPIAGFLGSRERSNKHRIRLPPYVHPAARPRSKISGQGSEPRPLGPPCWNWVGVTRTTVPHLGR